MKKYQIWRFNYINKNAVNLITGTTEESDEELDVLCFDGIAFFKAKGKKYIAKYIKMRKLNNYYKEKVEDYCGYEPTTGEYGVIMGALGIPIEVDNHTFSTINDYLPSLTKKDLKRIISNWGSLN